MSDRARTRSSEESRLMEMAAQRLPGGVLGSSRFPDDLGFVVKRGSGGKLWDVSGREYIDFLLGSGPMILGHAHPAVVAAVREQLENGTTYFLVNEPVIKLADELCRAVPCAEQVRFTSTGSEATFFALRAARAWRKREKIMKFEGGYHGSHDYALMSSSPKAPKAFPAATPDSAGIPHVIEGEVLVAPYNDLATVEALLAVHADALAAVIVEPFQRLLAPQAGFLAGLRALTTRYQIPLIFDEVVTGFRFAYGGAQEYYGVVPDLCALGKIIGGGFPLAAVAGLTDIMAHFDRGAVGDDGFLMQVGTLSGNPVAAAAGLATLEILRRPGAYENLFATGRELMGALTELLRRHGVTAQVTGEPPLFDAVFSGEPVRDYRGTLRGNADMLRRFNSLLRERGILKGEQKYYVSIAHTPDDVRRTREAWASALEALVR